MPTRPQCAEALRYSLLATAVEKKQTNMCVALQLAVQEFRTGSVGAHLCGFAVTG